MLKKTTAILMFVLIPIFFYGMSQAEAAEFKFGYVDLQKCLLKSAEGKKAFSQLKARKAQMQEKLDKYQAELDQLKEEMAKQGLMLSPEAKRDKERAFQRKLRDFNDMLNDFKEEMNREEERHKTRVLKDLADIIEAYGKGKGYTMIFEKTTSGLLWATKSTDLTDEIIKAYDAKKSKK